MRSPQARVLAYLGSLPGRAMPLSVIVARTGLSESRTRTALRELRKSHDVSFRGAHGTFAASWGITR